MAPVRARSSRLLTASVWGAGALLGLILVQFFTGWGSAGQAQLLNDLAYIPITLLTAALGLRLVVRGGLERPERRAWILLEVSFVLQVVAHAVSLAQNFVPTTPVYPAVSDYLYAAGIPFVVAGLLVMPVARRSGAERVKLLIDSLIVVAGACMALWYLEIGPLMQERGADPVVIAFSSAVPVLDLLLLFALITLLLRRPEAGAAMGLLAGSMALKVVADSTYTIAAVQLGVYFRPGDWPFVLWALGAALSLFAVHHRLRADEQTAGRQHSRRGRLAWLPYVAVALAYGLLAFAARDQSLYRLGGMVVGAVALTGLVIARQMFAQRENRRLAVTDPLTGLSNRMLIAERLAEVVRQPMREGRHSAVILIDLDRFKPINDTYGHEAGDAVLKAVAVALRTVIRSGDTAGRLGGDEFAVVLPALPSRAAAESIAQRLVDALRTPVIFGELVLAVEASIGIAFRDETTTETLHLMVHADAAMYAAKRAGRGQYRVFTADMDTRAQDAELRRAVENDELVVHFQPVVDLSTGTMVTVEALVRWNHPARGLLMPGAFIEVAEETGAVIPLGEWVLRDACRQAAAWRAEYPAEADALWLSVNLSARQVVLASLVDTIRGILDETGFPADRLVLELTESVVLQPDEPTVARLNTLREMGIGISVDDFGTGFAALSYLRLLPVSVLKIDRSFVDGIDTDPDAYAVAEAVVRLAQAYRLHVVAEGIETAEQARCLAEMGCGYGQGYHFARPMPGPALASLLAERQSSPVLTKS
ncbi:EAL domain-containing protein [Actinoplanes bogorensis]|uniref:EAL domain-containing protein n=1 Tax=Paractinoplanes bogorensis TaxID=1610840 RepID=A0ABS5YJM5_9ACTN|nr:EAL domain-containing protein [Actinoplanes bogorensis]MBU2663685.1 EAL domain-containing protein [Actinoplanes bogorensis]